MSGPGQRIIVVGGGAAGLMAALFAARGGAETILLEGAQACGLKILVSGGGRCNVLPDVSDDGDFFTSGSRNVLRRLFRTWRLDAVRAFFEDDLAIPLTLEEETGKLFPVSQRARDVRDALVAAVEAAGAGILLRWRVREIRRLPDDEGAGFEVTGEDREPLRAARLILATGGRSLPKTGSDGAGYEFAAGLGHEILPTYPALVPLTTGDPQFRELSGIALPVRWRALRDGKVLEERERELLFTHRGFSGPAILDASHWAVRDGARIEVAWGGHTAEDWDARWRADSRKRPLSLLSDHLPRRLVRLLVTRARIADQLRFAELQKRQYDRLLEVLCAFPLPVTGDEGYRKAEVTGGGIPLGEVNPSTLESRVVPGLQIVGEIFDVIGRIGGYNFLWAWVTGRLGGESAAAALLRG